MLQLVGTGLLLMSFRLCLGRGDLATLGILLVGEDFFFLELDPLLIVSSLPAVDFLFLADLCSGGEAPWSHSGDRKMSPSSSSSSLAGPCSLGMLFQVSLWFVSRYDH